VKLDPTPEEEEDLTTDVVLMVDKRKDSSVAVEHMTDKRKDSSVDAIEHIDKVILNLDDDDGASTLVGHEPSTGMFGEKEIDMEVEDSGNEETDQADEHNGVKRKRTIRVIIRSRAFL
jgi:hypothetical protein